jgi:hypothetical protein
MTTAPYFQLPAESIPMDEAMDLAYKALGAKRRGGPSGSGWSSRSVLMQCPRKYKLKIIDRVPVEDRGARSTGALWHEFTALHDAARIEAVAGEKAAPLVLVKPEDLRDALLGVNADGMVVSEAWRLYAAWASRYEADSLQPLAVEHFARHPSGFTCRYDAIVRIPAGGEVAPGTYICERKTARALDESTRDGWRNDGEVIGQMMVWKAAKLDKVFGPLQGVVMDIVIKTKMVQFHRPVVRCRPALLRQHASDLRFYDALEKMCRATGCWPRVRSSNSGCIDRWGKCDYYDHCARDDR